MEKVEKVEEVDIQFPFFQKGSPSGHEGEDVFHKVRRGQADRRRVQEGHEKVRILKKRGNACATYIGDARLEWQS